MAAVNIDAERKITQLNEEMQELVRGIKNRVSELVYYASFWGLAYWLRRIKQSTRPSLRSNSWNDVLRGPSDKRML
jgi:hypothetical protein